jgi:hypothetical protein
MRVAWFGVLKHALPSRAMRFDVYVSPPVDEFGQPTSQMIK